MDVLVYVAISVGVLSGVWAWMAAVFGMVSWTGFVGWTSYYSSGGMAKGIQAKLKKFEFISGAFCGCFSTFGLNGNWQAVIPALLCGNVLGYISQKIGIYCHKVFSKN